MLYRTAVRQILSFNNGSSTVCTNRILYHLDILLRGITTYYTDIQNYLFLLFYLKVLILRKLPYHTSIRANSIKISAILCNTSGEAGPCVETLLGNYLKSL